MRVPAAAIREGVIARASVDTTVATSGPVPWDAQCQVGPVWCWAAVASALGQARGRARRDQCEIASEITSGACCAAPPGHLGRPCDTERGLARVLRRLGLLASSDPHPPTTPSPILAELAAGRPVAVRVEDPEGRGHFVTIVGATGPPSAPTLLVSDPLPQRTHALPGHALRPVPWTQMLVNYGNVGARWTHTYYVL